MAVEQYNAKTFYHPNRGSLTVHSAEEEAIARTRGWTHEYPHNVVIQTSDTPPEHPDVTAIKESTADEIADLKVEVAALKATVTALSTPAVAPPVQP